MVLADVFSAVLALVFASAAVAKLVGQRQQVLTAEKLQIPWNRYRWIAGPEAIAAVGLVLGYVSAPLGATAAIDLAFLMAGALAFRLRVHDALGFLLGDATLLVLALATAVLRI